MLRGQRLTVAVATNAPKPADPSDASGRFGMVDFKAVEPLQHPVTLAQIKADRRLDDLALVRQARLSVIPVEAAAWVILCRLGGIEA